jgi:hypothetical protein
MGAMKKYGHLYPSLFDHSDVKEGCNAIVGLISLSALQFGNLNKLFTPIFVCLCGSQRSRVIKTNSDA